MTIIDSPGGSSTYDLLKGERGRKPVTIAELVLDYCGNEFGVSPCTASGADKCYNTFKSCQDQANYTASTKTYTFIDKLANLPAGITAFPALEKIQVAPTKIQPNGIGQRASVTVTFRDFPHHDRGVDPYISDRTYDANTQGSFFGKLKARNPFYVNRKLIIRTGYIYEGNFDTTFEQDFEERVYFIDRIETANANGQVKIIAKDILKLADATRAKAPVLSDGELNADITDAATSLVLASGYTTDYGTSGTIRINGEILSYTGKSTDTLTGLTRGLYNTVAAAHTAADSVQVCLLYTAQKPSDILEDLLTTYASIDPAYIPSAEWEAENDDKLASNNMTAVITTPTGVKNLVEEVLSSAMSYMWWDEVVQEIKFKVSFPAGITTPQSINDDVNIINDSMGVKDEEKSRISEVIVRYGQFDPVEENKDENFSNVYAQIDTDAEGANEYGIKSTLEINSRWITTSGAALEIAGRTLNLFATTPRRISFSLDAKDSLIRTGDVITVSSRGIQDTDGAQLALKFLITKRLEKIQGTTYTYEGLEFGLGSKIGDIGANTLLDYTAESEANQADYIFISDDLGFMSNGDDGYKIA